MHWVFLLLAILGEVAGTTSMKLLVSAGHPWAGTLVVTAMIGLSYVLLSQATLRIPIAMANAFWEGLGMILIATVSWLWLDEQIQPTQAAAIALAVVGIVILNIGHHRQESQV